MPKYKMINGLRYSETLLNLAVGIAGEDGTGKIDMSTVEKMFAVLASDNRYSKLEKRTLNYIRTNFEFTDDADTHLRKEIRSWAGKRAKRNKGGASKTSFKPVHFDEYVNEKTGKVFNTLEEWGASIVRPSDEYLTNEAMYFYLDSYECDYIVEVLEEGEPLDESGDSRDNFWIHRFLYRGCDGKIYGFIYKWHGYNGESLLVPFSEFEIEERVSYAAVPKKHDIPNELYYQDLEFFPKDGD